MQSGRRPVYEDLNFVQLIHRKELTAASITVIVPALAWFFSLTLASMINTCICAAMDVNASYLAHPGGCADAVIDAALGIIVSVGVASAAVMFAKHTRSVREGMRM